MQQIKVPLGEILITILPAAICKTEGGKIHHFEQPLKILKSSSTRHQISIPKMKALTDLFFSHIRQAFFPKEKANAKQMILHWFFK